MVTTVKRLREIKGLPDQARDHEHGQTQINNTVNN
jgi:hypothetical protein